jgi:hypothetical protein
MNNSPKLSLSLHFAGAMLVAAAHFATPKTASAQDLARGTFTLPAAAKLGTTNLSPGEYRFSVQSLDGINSIESIQAGNSRVEVTVIGTDRDSPIVSLMANASRPSPKSQPANSMEFGDANSILSISLKNLGVTIDFTNKRPADILRATRASEATAIASAKSTD